MDWPAILEFFEENGKLIWDNIWVFLLFGLFVILGTLTVCRIIYNKKIADLKERKALQKENQKLRSKCKSLEEQVRNMTINERMIEFAEESRSSSSAGTHIATALKKKQK